MTEPTTKKTSITDDLRSRLGNAESRQQELLTERGEIAFAATVEKQKAAVQRLEAINIELSALANEISVLEAALKEAHRREAAADEELKLEARRQNAREAEFLCAGVETIAQKFDATLAALAKHAQDYENEMAKIRRLVGTGPAYDHVRVFLARALRTSTMRTPLHLETIAPGDRVTVSSATAIWLQNFRVHIGRTLNAKPAAKEAA